MGRLIDGDALYKAMQDAEDLARQRVLDTESTLPYPNNLNPSYTRYLAQMDERTKAKEMVADASTVDAVSVRHGRWITHEVQINGYAYAICECTVCGASRPTILFPLAYCPNCGARMDGKDDDRNG